MRRRFLRAARVVTTRRVNKINHVVQADRFSRDQGLATVERSPKGSPKYCWRISRRTILPDCVLGSSGTITMARGRNVGPSTSTTVAAIAAGSSDAPSLG